MWPHQRLEERVAERLLKRLEPRIQHILDEFLTTDEGHQLLSDAISELVADLTAVPADEGVLSMPEQIILAISARMASRPLFRQSLARILDQ